MEVVFDFLNRVAEEILDPLMLLMAAGATIVFLYGVFKFIMNAGEESRREEGRSAIIWGLVGLVVIFGASALLNIAVDTFGGVGFEIESPDSLPPPSTNFRE